MSISSLTRDDFNGQVSNIELLQRNGDEYSKSTKFFLRTGRPGHLFLKPVYTAFTKTNLGSIPSKLEKTLIKSNTNKPISTFINNTISSFNKKNDLAPKEEKDIRKYTTSFSSKGFGIGFVSKVSRFSDNLSGYKPGPADYSPERNFTLLNKIERSTFGKSFFKKKTSLSLNSFNSNMISESKKRSSTTSKSKNLTDANNKEISKESEKNKGTYYFNSTSDRFNGGIFDSKNKNPGPGKYFFDTSNIIVKDPEKLSSGFVQPKRKIINPIYFYGINKNEKKKFGYHLLNKMKNGKINYAWRGYNNNEDSLSSYQKFNKSNNSLENNSTKITSVFTNNNNTSNLPSIYSRDKKSIINCSKTEYISISPDNNSSWINGYDESKSRNNKKESNAKKIMKFKKKDFFSLSSPRWDQGYFHDNATHFQVPGPAYYNPKMQNTKKSFNLNNKDFIYTNSLPFKNDDYYSTSSVLI
jgi:hypothetical protein